MPASAGLRSTMRPHLACASRCHHRPWVRARGKVSVRARECGPTLRFGLCVQSTGVEAERGRSPQGGLIGRKALRDCVRSNRLSWFSHLNRRFEKIRIKAFDSRAQCCGLSLPTLTERGSARWPSAALSFQNNLKTTTRRAIPIVTAGHRSRCGGRRRLMEWGSADPSTPAAGAH